MQHVLALFFTTVILALPRTAEASLGSWNHHVRPRGRVPSFTTGTFSVASRTDPSALISPRDKELKLKIDRVLSTSRAGGSGGVDKQDSGGGVDVAVKIVGGITQGLISVGRIVLPPTVSVAKSIVQFYRVLPTDALIAQAGLVYCFAGGYYPTLFSSLVAAQHTGWQVALEAAQNITDEALRVVDIATTEYQWDTLERREAFLAQTNLVLKTVDPAKINVAVGALYTTWLGISAVLEKEYARVISLSLALAHGMERAAHWILEPPVKLVVSKDYHKWVPVLIGWGCKGLAMNVAWRIQRILTASTSAIAGGVMFARASLRMLHRRGFHLFGLIDETGQESPLDEFVGFVVAAVGFWTQMEAQYKNNFSFEVPFPINLVTWPFDWLEKWIQWYITK